jgi:hypothetical protein
VSFKKIPCIDCVVLAICKAKVSKIYEKTGRELLYPLDYLSFACDDLIEYIDHEDGKIKSYRIYETVFFFNKPVEP